MDKKKAGDFIFVATIVAFFVAWLHIASSWSWLWGGLFGWIPAAVFAWLVMFFGFLFTTKE